MGDDASTVREVDGTIEIDVDEINNAGTFRAELELPEGTYVVEMDQVVEFHPCQDGGIAAFLYEHGDAGCGDMNWPKSLLYVAGWGTGSATLNDELLYEDYQIHFMVTQGMRDRDTLATMYPLAGRTSAAGGRQSRAAAGRLLHPQPGHQRRESSQPRGLRPFLCDGDHVALA